MAEIIDGVKKETNGENVFLPVFITCDPVRDTPEVLRSYLQEFHPGIVGLTGTYEQVKNVCKQYRVYFSTPQNVKPGEDYLVDHSIYFYLMGECFCLFDLMYGWDGSGLLTGCVQILRVTLSSVLDARIRLSRRPS